MAAWQPHTFIISTAASEASLIPPLSLRLARIISHIPEWLLQSMALQAEHCFSKILITCRIRNSNLEQVQLNMMDKKKLFCVPPDLTPSKKTSYIETLWNLLIQQLQDGLHDCNDILYDKVLPSFLRTNKKYSRPQEPHLDYNTKVLNKKESCWEYPWIALIPLARDGAFLFVWESPDKPETLLHVPYSYMLLLLL